MRLPIYLWVTRIAIYLPPTAYHRFSDAIARDSAALPKRFIDAEASAD